MTNNFELENRLAKLNRSENPYAIEAYDFVLRAVDYTIRKERVRRHVRGDKLVDRLVDFALEQFGPMSLEVLNRWNIRKSEDIGVIVFDLVEVGLLKKTEKDSIDDFRKVDNFSSLFSDRFKWKI